VDNFWWSMDCLLNVAICTDECPQCQEEQVLIKGELVLHILHLGNHLEGHEAEPDQIFSHFCQLNVVWKIVILLEDEGGMCVGRHQSFQGGVEAFLNWLLLWEFE
jgi:hypothetical protein